MDILNCTDSSAILRPTIVRVGNCNFRSYDIVENKATSPQLEPYLDNDEDMLACVEIEDDLDIKMTKTGKFSTQFHIASAFHGSIIGSKGTRKKEIEFDTDTIIKIPKLGETGDIIITGSTERGVASATMRVRMIVLQSRDKQSITHFISIKTSSDEIRNNYATFKSKILSGPPIRGVDETIFQIPEKLHLTIAPLVLLDDVEKDLAIQALHNFQDELNVLFKNAGSLKIVLEGLEIMNDDPTDVDVLYGKVKLNMPKYNSTFQQVADKIVQLLSKKGLMRQQYEHVKLHVTLMNTLFKKRAQGASNREAFDASFILNNFKNYYFGEVDFTEISLVIRFTTADDKFYERLTTIKL